MSNASELPPIDDGYEINNGRRDHLVEVSREELYSARKNKRPRPMRGSGRGSAIDEEVTHHRIAERFATDLSRDFKYVKALGKWFRWTGKRWKEDTTGAVLDALRRYCARFGKKAQSSGFVAGVETFACCDTRIAVDVDAFDRDPMLLGTPDGVVDLRTGKLQPARQTDMVSKSTSVVPTHDAKCPKWLAFLEFACQDDQDMVEFLQRWCGYCLTGDVSEDVLAFIYGPGGNGKTVFSNTLTRIADEYAEIAPMGMFMSSPGDRHPTEIARLVGARLVTASETQKGRTWDEAKIKQLTGGDKLTGRFMRENFFDFDPTHKLTIIGNHKPILKNLEDSIKRRIIMMPFLVKPEKKNKYLEDELVSEWPGILRWMIDGCLDWQRNGLVIPDSVKRSTQEYFDSQDLLGQWLEDCCEVDYHNDALTATSAMLFASWQEWVEKRGERPRTQQELSETIGSRNIARPDKNVRVPGTDGRHRGFKGIKLKRGALSLDP